ncbi:MAG: membrane protein YdbS with pleckstrin-like domain [Marinoscillum sp.]|jgi:membrane protein YdbS with pleckstrin-like domain
MNKSTRNLIRLVSAIIVLALVLMQLNIIPDLLNYKFWFMTAAYAMAIITYK